MAEIDWSVFDGEPEQTVGCRCGVEYRSHVKVIYEGDLRGIYTQQPCPNCGCYDNARRASTDPETMTIGATTPPAVEAETFFIRFEFSDYSKGALDREDLAQRIFDWVCEGDEDPGGDWSIDGWSSPTSNPERI